MKQEMVMLQSWIYDLIHVIILVITLGRMHRSKILKEIQLNIFHFKVIKC